AKSTSPTPRTGQDNVWMVSANVGNEDKTEEFLKGGYWSLNDGLPDLALEMKPGERIAMKSPVVRKVDDVPFENYDIPVSTMIVKARGEIRRVENDRVQVDWDSDFTAREWYFFTHRHPVWRLSPNNRWSPHLARFIFEDEEQDIDAFLNSEVWRRYRDEGERRRRLDARRPSKTSYRKANPSADKVYDAVDAWKAALLEGRSLFSQEPFDYREAAAGFVEYFVKRPDIGEGTFTGKLYSQLEDAPTSTVQLAAEIMFIYTLPMQPSRMKHETKVSHIREILSWRATTSPLPEELEAALRPG